VKKTYAQRETLTIATSRWTTKWDGIYVGRRKGDDLVYAGSVDHGFDKVSVPEAAETPYSKDAAPYSKRIAHKGIWVETSSRWGPNSSTGWPLSLASPSAKSERRSMAKRKFERRFPTRDSAAVQALALNVRRLRKAKEWSQDQLAAEVGIEQNAVSLIENGRSNPTLLVVEEIARALNVRLDELLEAPVRPRRSKDR
jgi:DNA-binding XRE family transcriptional regulator